MLQHVGCLRWCQCGVWKAVGQGDTTIQMQEYMGLNSNSEVTFWKIKTVSFSLAERAGTMPSFCWHCVP